MAGNTIRHETEQLGQCQADMDAEVRRQGQDEDCLQAQLRQALVIPQRLYGSIDAAKVRMEPRTQAREGEKWRDLKLGCWYTAEVVRPIEQSARQRDMAARDQPVYRVTQPRYYCGIDEADNFGQLLWGTGCQIGAERVPELLAVLGLTDASNTLVADYSTGLRKTISLAAAVLHAPRVLFLDEPFESVDPVSARAIQDVLEVFCSRGGTVILSSHVMDTVERMCDHVAIIHMGRVMAAGPVDEIRGGRRLEDVFIDAVGGRIEVGGQLDWLEGPTRGVTSA